MILRPDTSYETNSMFPSTDWYKEGNTVIDEATVHGAYLAGEIIRLYPNYALVLNDKGEIADIAATVPDPAVLRQSKWTYVRAK